MRDRDEGELSPLLESAIESLRVAPEPSPQWRTELLARLALIEPTIEPASERSPSISPTPRRWSARPVAAIAAGLVCVLAGAGTMAVVYRTGMRNLGGEIATATMPAPLSPVTNASVTVPVRFALVAPRASRVTVVGDFNQWDPAGLALRRAEDGRTWEVEVRLPPGRYSYSFVVDGRLARDPSAPQDAGDDFGSANSILMLRGS